MQSYNEETFTKKLKEIGKTCWYYQLRKKVWSNNEGVHSEA